MLNIKFTLKLFILFVFIIEFNGSSKAQAISYLHSGTYNFSGSIDFTLTTETLPGDVNYTEKFINCSPAGSYFIIDRLSIGLGIDYNYAEKHGIYADDYNYYDASIAFGPLVRYYFIDDRLAPFAEIAYTHDIFSLSQNTKYLGYSASIGLGMNYFATKSFSIEPYIDYQYKTRLYYVASPQFPIYGYLTDQNILYGLRVNYFIN